MDEDPDPVVEKGNQVLSALGLLLSVGVTMFRLLSPLFRKKKS